MDSVGVLSEQAGSDRLAGLDWELIGAAPRAAGLQLALDEVLLDRVASGQRPPTLRFWAWSEAALVLGSHQVLANEVDLEEASRMGIRVLRRMSGGGTMLNLPGASITYSLYVPAAPFADLSLAASYALFDSWVVAALRALGVPASYRPLNDLIDGRGKMGGAAQARRRGAILHHTTIAWSIEPELIPRLIRIGRPPVVERGVRSAEKVVSPMTQHTSLSREQVEEHMARWFTALTGARPGSILEDEEAAARELAEQKYETEGWLRRLE
ncbi:MAG TPA: biotin/lipoate A/B protein ligase family protein [Candidatus Nitrosotalea sp.]|nr:biotin/lipoate A/B protein ligase family protein [Candidatus Nitrosotalea sp.]